MENKPTKQQIITLMAGWIKQRPGLEFGNYGDVTAYRAELRGIARDKRHAQELLGYVARFDSITADMLIDAFNGAYSGRLQLKAYKGGWALDYCAGQYWPTEYRKAACAVLASAIWNWTRDYCMPAPTIIQHGSATDHPMVTEKRYGGMRAGDWLRAYFRREFGRSIASRWFN